MTALHPTLALLLAGGALALPLCAQKALAPLEQARKLLFESREEQVKEGGAICVAQNSPAAVELLLEVLAVTAPISGRHLPPAHYRDIVWDSLTAITDPYARERVVREMRTTKDSRIRQWCAELVGIYGDAKHADALLKTLKSNEDDVKRWAARSLGMLRHADAFEELARLRSHKNDFVRANAIEAAARVDAARGMPQFLESLTADRSGGVRCALLGAAAELCADRIESLSAKALADPDWRPRLQAVEHLGKIRTKSAVDALIRALDDARPVVALRALRELQELCGQPIAQREVWPKWWADHRAEFAFPDGRGIADRNQASTVTYNAVPIESDHIAFMLDKSLPMRESLQDRDGSKEEAALAEFERVLGLLDGRVTFNVFNYDLEVEAMAKAAVELSAKNRRRAIAFASAEAKGRAKDIWQVLETVCDDPTLDTAFLLSSGEPDTGLYVHSNRVTRHLKDLNRFHKVTVHTIAYSDREWYRSQLEAIAVATGGHFEWLK